MVLLDLQNLEVDNEHDPETAASIGGGGDSGLSLLLCDVL